MMLIVLWNIPTRNTCIAQEIIKEFTLKVCVMCCSFCPSIALNSGNSIWNILSANAYVSQCIKDACVE